VLSARTESSLQEAGRALGEHLRDHPTVALADVAHTLAVGRKEFDERIFCVADSSNIVQELARACSRYRSCADSKRPRIVVELTGTAAELLGLCREYHDASDAFRDLVERFSPPPESITAVSLKELLLQSDVGAAGDETQCRFLLHTLLLRFLTSLGIAPAKVIAENDGLETEERSTCRLIVGPEKSKAADEATVTGPKTLALMRHEQSPTEYYGRLLNVVGELWRMRVPLELRALYVPGRRRRVVLPGYCFERESYWTTSDSRPTDVSSWFYVPVWRQSPLVAVRGSGTNEPATRWVLLASVNDEVATAIEGELRRLTRAVVRANPGDLVDPGSTEEALREELGRLCRDATAGTDEHCHFVLFDSYLAQLKGGPGENRSDCSPWFLVPLFITQAFGTEALERVLPPGRWPPISLSVVSRNMFGLYAQEGAIPEKSLAAALGKVIQQEYPHVRFRVVDLLQAQYGDYASSTGCRAILDELNADGEQAVLLRGPHRWVRSYEPLRVRGAREANPLRTRGVYIITGGLGGIGLELAEFLAGRYRARLVLVTRSAFPPSAHWPEYLTYHDGADPTCERIRRLQRVLELGAEVDIVSGDVADRDAMMRLKVRVLERFGVIHGIIHAAGSAPRSVLQRMTPASASAVLSAKVAGSNVLREVFAAQPLDFLVLFSSLRAITGGVGTADYAAANAFQDELALSSWVATSGRVRSVSWAGWEQVGMSRNPANAATAAAGLHAGVPVDRALEAFTLALGNNLPHVVVCSHDLNQLIQEFRVPGDLSHLLQPGATDAPQAPVEHERALTLAPYVAPRTEHEAALARIWEEMLGTAPIGVHDDFLTLGGDSVVSLQIAAKARQRGLVMRPFATLERGTIAACIEAALPQASAAQGVVEESADDGQVPLTPIQSWFFAQPLSRPQHFNQAFLLRATRRLVPGLLQQALDAVVVHHDALRSQFVRRDDRWRQLQKNVPAADSLRVVILRPMQPHELAREIEQRCAQEQSSLELQSGPLFRIVMFDTGSDEPQLILAYAHHLVVDVLSWKIVLEDLCSGYRQLLQGEALSLPSKTTSFRAWAQHLLTYAGSPEVRTAADYWRSQAQQTATTPWPRDFPNGRNTVATSTTLVRDGAVFLPAPETRGSPAPLTVFLGALGNCLGEWLSDCPVTVDLEGHGREPLFSEVDLSRTVGWFTTLYPLQLHVRPEDQPEEVLARVEHSLRSLPHHGLDYGVLSYLSPDAQPLRPASEMLVLYLGRLGQGAAETELLRLAPLSPGWTQHPEDERPYPLELTGQTINNRLRLTLTFSTQMYQPRTLEVLLERMLRAYERLCAAVAAEPVINLSGDLSHAYGRPGSVRAL
jgi:non-ribosomal peptide synthase protein (TIGR01720 family)